MLRIQAAPVVAVLALAVAIASAQSSQGPPLMNTATIKAPGKTTSDLVTSISTYLDCSPSEVSVVADPTVGTDGFKVTFNGPAGEMLAEMFDFADELDLVNDLGITYLNGRNLSNETPPPTGAPPQSLMDRLRQIEGTIVSAAHPLNPGPDNCTEPWLASQQDVINKAHMVAQKYSIPWVVNQYDRHYGFLLDPVVLNKTQLISDFTWSVWFVNQSNFSSYPFPDQVLAEQTREPFLSMRATLAIAEVVNYTRWCFYEGEAFPTPEPTVVTRPPILIDTALYESLELGAVRQGKDGTSGCPSWVFDPVQYASHVPAWTTHDVIEQYYLTFAGYLPANFRTIWTIWSDDASTFYATANPTGQWLADGPTFASVKAALVKFRITLEIIAVQSNYSHCFEGPSTTLPPGFHEPVRGDSTLAIYSQILYNASRLRAAPMDNSCPDFIKGTNFGYYMQDATAVEEKTDAWIVANYWADYGHYFPEVLNQTLFLELVAIGKADVLHPPDSGSSFPTFSSDDGFPSGLPSDASISVGSSWSEGSLPPLPSGHSESFDPSQLGSGSWLPFVSSQVDMGSSNAGSAPQPPPSRLELGQNALSTLHLMRQTLAWTGVVGEWPHCFNLTMILTLPPEPTDPPGLSPLTLEESRYITYQASLFREVLPEIPPGSNCPAWTTHETFVNDYITNAYVNYSDAQVIQTYYDVLEPKVVAMLGGQKYDPANLIAWAGEANRFFTTGDGVSKDIPTYTKIQTILGIMRNTLGYYKLTVLEWPQCFGALVTESPPTYEPGSGSGQMMVGQLTNAVLSRMYEILAWETRNLINPLPPTPTCPSWMQDSTAYQKAYNDGTLQTSSGYTPEGVINQYTDKWAGYFGQTGLNKTKLLEEYNAGQQIIQNGGTGIKGVTDSDSGVAPASQQDQSQTHPNVIPTTALEAVQAVKTMRQTIGIADARAQFPQCYTTAVGTAALLPQWHPDTTAYELVNQQYRRERKTNVPGCPTVITNSTQFDEYLMTGDERISDSDCIQQYSQKFAPGLTANDATIPVTAAIAWNNAAVKYYNESAFTAQNGYLEDKYHLVRESVQLFQQGLARADLYERYPQCFGDIITGQPTLPPDFGNSGVEDPNAEYMTIVLQNEAKARADPLPGTCPVWMGTKTSFDDMMQSGNISNTLDDTQAVTEYLNTWGGNLPVNITVGDFIQTLNDARAYQAANPNGGLGANSQMFGSGSLPPIGSGSSFSFPSFGDQSQFSGSVIPGFSSFPSSFTPISQLPSDSSLNQGSNGGGGNIDMAKENQYMSALMTMQLIRQTVGWKIAKTQWSECFSTVVPTYATGTTAPPTSTGTPAPMSTGTTLPLDTTAAPPTPPPTSIPVTPMPTPVPATPAPVPPTPAPPTPEGQTMAPETPAPPTPAPPTPAGQTMAPATPEPPTPAPETPEPPTPAPPTPVGQTMAPPSPAPVTPAPDTAAPPSPAPPTPEGGTMAPPSPAPITPAPDTPTPGTPAPPTPEPPVTPTPPTPEPVAQSPAPATSAPATSAPTKGTPAPGSGSGSQGSAPTTTADNPVFEATLEPGKTPADLKKKLADELGVPEDDIDVTSLGKAADGGEKVSFQFKGANAGLNAQKLEDNKSVLASTVESGTLKRASAEDNTPAEPEKSNTALIVAVVVGAVVVVLVLVGVVVKVASGGKGGDASHTNYRPHESNQLQEELVDRNDQESYNPPQDDYNPPPQQDTDPVGQETSPNFGQV